MRRLPWVGLPTDTAVHGHHRFAMAGEKYVRALAEAAQVTPLLLPSLQPPLPSADWLQGLDGLLLTGAVSNIEPQHYEGGRSWPGNPHDPARDANAFALLHEALARDLPVLAICRGFQELNVALGGSLHPQVHAVAGLADHREDPAAAVDVQYGPAHALTLAEDGWLAGWHGGTRAQVNSVHGQGIARLADDLLVEAWADDGLVEAARSRRHRFVLGVQWHPEWRVMDAPFYHAIFRAFGQACRQHHLHRLD
ncbi:gamma-glutamyl-gamma-aminobutyrate hydrolase family protein [Stenotrophomonas tuberculopleuritidis]|uniref:gamma-glutamyl-gamma-aminobutyrate hydrolase family protein n=1 Tax=Stenotrophomonas tuberculopleuritidis TaxID=3055079 RepID=UPI0026E57CEC|nr:gamma-glutamyl-gamma-aminobutyrate hydrolase family protein [Stenotrophomonas sp. 704A1]